MKNLLRTFRESLGLSRNDMAAAIGKSPQTLEKYEAEAPNDFLRLLADYAKSINREDAAALLLPALSKIRKTKIAVPYPRHFARKVRYYYKRKAGRQ